jgi:hypothetical protein
MEECHVAAVATQSTNAPKNLKNRLRKFARRYGYIIHKSRPLARTEND